MIDIETFAHDIFGSAELGDERLTRRAVTSLALLGAARWSSLVEACRGDDAAQQGLYRWIRNDRIKVEPLIDAACTALGSVAASQCKGDILAIQDTTCFSFQHSVVDQLGSLGTGRNRTSRGFFCHLTVGLDADNGAIIGPLDAQFGLRSNSERPSARDHRALAYEDKESFKWESAAAIVDQRNAAHRQRLIFVSDRESDVYEYLQFMRGHDLRFVVRSSWNRRVDHPEKWLRPTLDAEPVLCRCTVQIEQRAGRPARRALMEVRTKEVTLDGRNHGSERMARLTFNAVRLTEVEPPDPTTAIDWTLLSTEPIESVDEVLCIVRFYCMRWSIEEYNKCCKSDGVNAESLRMQAADNLLRALVLMVFSAIPIVRLRASLMEQDSRTRWPVLVAPKSDKTSEDDRVKQESKCDSVLPDLYWQVLWLSVNKTQPVPTSAPGLKWALLSLARLGGFNDSKHTGRPGYPALWKGWDRLLDRVDAYQMALAVTQNNHPPNNLSTTTTPTTTGSDEM